MNLSSSIQPPGAAASWDHLSRLARRACLLAEQGDVPAATRLRETELAAAVRDFRQVHGPDRLTEPALQALLAEEARRVAEAVILADLMLARLQSVTPAAFGQLPRPPVGSSPAPGGRPRPAGAAAPPISDLLDAMLAAERPGRPPPARVPPAT